MSKKEELEKLLHGELDDIYCYKSTLDDIYCYNCSKEKPCDRCPRKYIQWKPFDELIHSIVEIAMRKEE